MHRLNIALAVNLQRAKLLSREYVKSALKSQRRSVDSFMLEVKLATHISPWYIVHFDQAKKKRTILFRVPWPKK